ncbi:MAG: molecular chaperone DnaJ [Actinomycetota bacterium]|nr:MAG: molecular chaperone DnaJ [Actinomycetota bacterium]
MVETKRDYYEVLGISRTCTKLEIKKAYRKMAREYHPDVNNGDPQAEENFKEISEAYAVLSSDDKRQQYDRFGFSKNLFEDFDFSSAFSEFGFGDIFNTFFGSGFGGGFGGGSRKTRSRGSDIGARLEISFKEAAFGVKKEIEYPVDDICEKCGGKGAENDDDIETCGQCGGAGKVRVTRQTFIGNVITTSTCDSCGGSGKTIKNPCRKCSGQGHYHIKKKIKVDIPAGIHDGDRMRVTGKGNSLGRDSINGDLFITVSVAPHKSFKRDGDNVLSEINISFAQAALGVRLEAETLDGPEKISIKPGTQPGTKVILRSRGFVQLNGYRRGNHIINIKVNIPSRLNRQEKEMLTHYAERRKEQIN